MSHRRPPGLRRHRHRRFPIESRIQIHKDPEPAVEGSGEFSRQLAGIPRYRKHEDDREILSPGDPGFPNFTQLRPKEYRNRGLEAKVLSMQDPNRKISSVSGEGDGKKEKPDNDGKVNNVASSSKVAVDRKPKNDIPASIPIQSAQPSDTVTQTGHDDQGNSVRRTRPRQAVPTDGVIQQAPSDNTNSASPPPEGSTQAHLFRGHHAQTQSPPFRVQKHRRVASSQVQGTPARSTSPSSVQNVGAHRRVVSTQVQRSRSISRDPGSNLPVHRRIASLGAAPVVQPQPQPRPRLRSIWQLRPLTPAEAQQEAILAAQRAAQYVVARETHTNLKSADEMREARLRQAAGAGIQARSVSDNISNGVAKVQSWLASGAGDAQPLPSAPTSGHGSADGAHALQPTPATDRQRPAHARADSTSVVQNGAHRQNNISIPVARAIPIQPLSQRLLQQPHVAAPQPRPQQLQALAPHPLPQLSQAPAPRPLLQQPRATAPARNPTLVPLPKPFITTRQTEHAQDVLLWQRHFADVLQAGAEDPAIVTRARGMSMDELRAAGTLMALGRPTTPPIANEGTKAPGNAGLVTKLWCEKTIEVAVESTAEKLKAEGEKRKDQEMGGDDDDKGMR